MKYGLMNYSYGKNKYFVDVNFGDEIQSIAASYFLPKIDYFIDRENINYITPTSEKIKMIMNGWYMHDSEQWPPAKNILPLLISMHISPNRKNFIKNIFCKENISYLIENGPIGCRDIGTLNLFKKHNIPAYFSGCLTLTLPKNKHVNKQSYILCVDVKENVINCIKNYTHRPIISISPVFNLPIFDKQDKFLYAFKYLNAYQSAAAVITTRLHAAMPCLALETPVLLLDDSNGADTRFLGLNKLIRNISSKDYINNLDFFNLNNIAQNSTSYLNYRKKLIQKCEAFTGNKQTSVSPLEKIYTDEEQNVTELKVLSSASLNSKNYNILNRFSSGILFKQSIKRKIYKIKNKKHYYKT